MVPFRDEVVRLHDKVGPTLDDKMALLRNEGALLRYKVVPLCYKLMLLRYDKMVLPRDKVVMLRDKVMSKEHGTTEDVRTDVTTWIHSDSTGEEGAGDGDALEQCACVLRGLAFELDCGRASFHRSSSHRAPDNAPQTCQTSQFSSSLCSVALNCPTPGAPGI